MAGSHVSFWASLPPATRPRPPSTTRGEVRAGIGGAAHLLQHERQLDDAEPCAAVLLGERQAEPAQLGHLAPERLAVAERVVHHRAHVGGLALLVEELARTELLQHDLIVGEGEVHRVSSRRRSARGSLGSRRTRSPMMFFWISDEPA